MEVWEHGGRRYELVSFYSVPADAWYYDLSGPGASGARCAMLVIVPDLTPDDGPFTPMDEEHVVVSVGPGEMPWPVLARLIEYVTKCGDLVPAPSPARVTGDLSRPANEWRWADRRFAVTTSRDADHGCWRWRLREPEPAADGHVFVEVRVPDLTPDGPFTPASARCLLLTMHGESDVPWPVFSRFVGAVNRQRRRAADRTAAAGRPGYEGRARPDAAARRAGA